MRKYSIKKAVLLLSLWSAWSTIYAQTGTENYVYSKTYLSDPAVANAKASETITYFDGLGRPKQVVNVKAATGGKDLVVPITYDGFGRQSKNILPVPANSQNSGIHAGITDETPANSYYGVTNAFAEKEFDTSPLDRVLQQGQPGDPWKLGGGHTQKYKYEANAAGEVKKFITNTTVNTVNGVSNTVTTVAVSSENAGNYPEGVLYKNKVTDEDGNPVVQFVNGRGQALLIRKNDGAQNIDTYYVYNEYNQVAFIIPPKAVQQITAANNVISQVLADQLCYQYSYDGQGREVEKKLPGKGWEYTVYDKQNRPVLYQDTVLRTTTNNFGGKGWVFTKYDEFDRIVYTGFFANTASRPVMQNALNSMALNSQNNEKRDLNGPIMQNGFAIQYSKNAFPTGSMNILTVNYYDTYPPEAPAVPSTILGQYTLSQTLSPNDDASTKNILTASYVKNIEDDKWTKTYHYYDSKGRVVGTKSFNHLEGYTYTDLKRDFTGLIEEKYTYHVRSRSDTEVKIKERFIYDTQNRLVKQYHQVDNLAEELLAENTYNEIGQLINKKTGNNTGTPLQSVDYSYNIRGWMTSVNNPNSTAFNNKLFGFERKYDNPADPNAADPKYNGNISEFDWKTANGTLLRRYAYTYDKLDRLKNAAYREPAITNPVTDGFSESITYDVNGNIQTLKRFQAFNNTPLLIDDLTYNIYTGNQLIKVTDGSTNNSGYPGGGSTIGYDLNGNMKDHLDKGIVAISYNFLNLPKTVKFAQNDDNIKFIYRADGVKLNKSYTYFASKSGLNLTETTEYLDGFQYEDLGWGQGLQFFPTDEGYFDFQKKRYVYNYEDHVGNIRLAYYKGDNNLPVIDKETNYYPFGLEYGGYNGTYTQTESYRYGFQGQEKQKETGWSSFKWRNSIPELGRFFNVDPLSEEYNTWSVYAFSGNRVIDARELEGREPVNINKTTKNLVIVNQGYVGSPPPGATQSQNYAKYNKDGGIDYDGIGIINNLNSATTQVGVFASAKGEVTKNDILTSIKSFRKQSPDGKLIMVGHSMGADNLVELVNEHTEVKVDLLFTLDIADDPLSGADDDNISSNVKTAVNYYNKNDGFMHSAIGGEDIEANDSSKTKILNVPVNSPHTQIDNTYRYNAYNAVVKELNKK